MEKQNHVCKNCGRETENQIELVTLKTMVDRGWKKNKYFQAMGDIINTALCDDCLDEHIAKVTNPQAAILKLSILSLIVFAGCSFLFWFVEVTAFRVFCAIIAGITVLAFLQELKRITQKAEKAKKLSDTERRKAMATDLLSRLLPKKHNDAELAYIDVRRVMRDNPELLAKEYGFSHKKMLAIRNFLREEKRKQKLEEDSGSAE
ncbi:MAG: hypothetical protein WBK54_03300 [Bacilli bacterium]|nr:hypothetical protein [Acholeplasmataceae bacterium]